MQGREEHSRLGSARAWLIGWTAVGQNYEDQQEKSTTLAGEVPAGTNLSKRGIANTLVVVSRLNRAACYIYRSKGGMIRLETLIELNCFLAPRCPRQRPAVLQTIKQRQIHIYIYIYIYIYTYIYIYIYTCVQRDR